MGPASKRAAPRLVGPRVVVRLVEPRDAEAMVHYLIANRAHLAPWEPPRPPEWWTPEHWRQTGRQALRDLQADVAVRLVIEPLDAPGTIAGTINLTQIVRGAFQACFLGYGLAGERQGQGLMQEALGLALGYAFGDLKLHRVMANHVPENERSAKVLQALGFVREGLARDYLWIDGAWRDHVLNALTHPHWVV